MVSNSASTAIVAALPMLILEQGGLTLALIIDLAYASDAFIFTLFIHLLFLRYCLMFSDCIIRLCTVECFVSVFKLLIGIGYFSVYSLFLCVCEVLFKFNIIKISISMIELNESGPVL